LYNKSLMYNDLYNVHTIGVHDLYNI